MPLPILIKIKLSYTVLGESYQIALTYLVIYIDIDIILQFNFKKGLVAINVHGCRSIHVYIQIAMQYKSHGMDTMYQKMFYANHSGKVIMIFQCLDYFAKLCLPNHIQILS